MAAIKGHEFVTLLLEGLAPSNFHQNVCLDQTNIFCNIADDVRPHLISIISGFGIINELFSIGDNFTSRPPTAPIQKPLNAYLEVLQLYILD